MPLLLRIAGLPDPDANERLVEVDSLLRIGRSVDNDLVLPDPERVLSKLHCVIRREAGRYLLYDSSANGTFLNDARHRLPRDRAAPLTAGDEVHLGPFTLSVVSIIVPEPDPAASAAGLLGPVSHAPGPVVPAPPRAQREIDDLLSGFNASPGSDIGEFLGDDEPEPWRATAAPSPTPDPRGPVEDALVSRSPHKEAIPADWDPLADVGGLSPRPADPHPAKPKEIGSSAGRSDEIGPGNGRPRPAVSDHGQSQPGQSDVVGPGQPEHRPPGETQQPAIDRPPFDPAPDRAFPRSAEPGPGRWGSSPDRNPAWDAGDPPDPGSGAGHADKPHTPDAPRAFPPAQRGAADVAGAGDGGAAWQPPGAAQRIDPGWPAQGPIPTDPALRPGRRLPDEPPLRPTSVATAGLTAGAGSRGTLDRMLSACGLEPETLSDEQAIVAAERAGRILHIAVDGMLRILGSRSVAKQEFGIERTAISRGDNNPLKFVNTAAEALQMLLCTDLPGFLPAEDAMRETIDDIGGHQLALLAGVQAAVANTMRRLDPAVIEATLPSYAADPLVPALRRARAWEQYRATYADLARSLEEGGREGFGGEFARGYAAIRPAAARSRTQTSETSPDDH